MDMGSKYRGSPEEVATLSAYISMVRATEGMLAALGEKLAPHELSVSQFGMLDALYHLGPLKQGTLAQKILRSNGNVTALVDGLARRGLVERRRNSNDRRCVTVHLTAVGRALFELILPDHVGAIRAHFSALDQAEQETLRALCSRLGRHVPTTGNP
jgi:MarR family 2-MHQ and catechol resistance regulon transcriptional repressor